MSERRPTSDELTRECVLVGCLFCEHRPLGERRFRPEPPGFEDRRQCMTATRLAVLPLVVDHEMSFEGLAALGRFLPNLPKLAATTVLRWYREAGDETDFRGHMEGMVAIFSGQLAMDEVYENGIYVIGATDPLAGVEISSWLGDGSPCAPERARVFLELQAAGFMPQFMVTDGSPLYREVITEVWPKAKHQRCVFHFVMG